MSTAADELDLLFAAPVRVTVGGESVAVRGVVLDELAGFLRLYDDQPDEASTEAEIDAWNTRMLAMLARLCDRPVQWLDTLAEDQLGTLFAAMRRANAVLFGPQPARGGPRTGRGNSWATVVAQLIECGHTLHTVRGYTLAQIEVLSAAHARIAVDRSLDALGIARAAQATTKGYRQAMADLKQSRARLG